MKTFVLLLLMATTLTGAAPPDNVLIGFPGELYENGYSNRRDGNSSRFGLLHGRRLQQVYSAEYIAATAPQGGHIVGIIFRADRVWKGSVDGEFTGLQISMGYTSVDPSQMSAEFARNLSSDLRIVRTSADVSPLRIASSGTQRLGPDVVVLGFRGDGFFYDPSLGNLVIDILPGPESGLGLPFDFHVPSQSRGDVGSVFADLGFPGYPDSGVVSAGGFVTELYMFRVPEPGVVGLAALGGAALLAASRQRKNNQG